MKKTLIISLLLLTAAQAHAASAFWTGQTKFVTTVTYQQAVACEYRYLSQTFWRLFPAGSSCHSSVEVI